MPHLAGLGMPPGGYGKAEHQLDALITLIRRLGYADIEARLLAEREILASSGCRIAVAGAPGTGKSTLINRRFLSADLLPMDGGTAVATEICRGRDRRMEIFPYLERQKPPLAPDLKAPGVVTALSACEGPPAVIVDPSPAEIQRHTSAATASARERMARTTARVRILLPSTALAGMSLVDTPGIGPMNRAAVTTRYRILAACDRILFTARAETLSAAEKAFLESPVLLDRDVCRLPPGDSRVNSAAGSPGRKRPMTEAGRAKRTERTLEHQAALALARCGAERAARGKNMGECRRIEGRIRALEAEIRIGQARVLAGLKRDLAALEAQVSDTAGRDIRDAVARYARGILETAAPSGTVAGPLFRHLETAMRDGARQMMAAVQSLAERSESDGRTLLAPWEDRVCRELGAGAVPEVHTPFSIRAMDAIAEARMNPFGILADILPGIIAALPCGPARIAQRLRVIHMDMPHRVEGMFRPIAETLPAQWDDDVNSRLGAVRQGVSAASGMPEAPDRQALLTAGQAALIGFIREIPVR